MQKWFYKEAGDNDVVMFSRVKLSRNLKDTPFKSKMSREIRKGTVKKLYAAVKNSALAGDFELVDLTEKPVSCAAAYAERQVVSPDFAREKGAFLVSNDESASVMLCGEDHIKITAFAPGLDIEGAYFKAGKVDDVFLSKLSIAFDERLGFLTASPANLGTGMKISVGLHLPGIKANGKIERLASLVSKLGLTLRPLYHENSAFYLLTNNVSLGITEAAAAENIKSVAGQIVAQERELRKILKENEETEDILYRSLGTLKMARRLSFSEFIKLASDLKLGAALGYFDIGSSKLGELMFNCADGCILNLTEETDVHAAPRLRAEIIRNILN